MSSGEYEEIVVYVASSSDDGDVRHMKPETRARFGSGDGEEKASAFTSLNTTEVNATTCGTSALGLSTYVHGSDDGPQSLMSSEVPALPVPMPALRTLMHSSSYGGHDSDSCGAVDGAYGGKGHSSRLSLRMGKHGRSTDGGPEESCAGFLEGDELNAVEGSPSSADLALQLVADVTFKANARVRAWDRWVRRLEARTALHQHRELLAQEYYERNTRYLFFRAWQWRFSRHAETKENERLAMTSRMRHVCRRVVCAWQEQVKRRKDQRLSAEALSTRVAVHRLRGVWQRWLRYWEHRALARALAKVTSESHQSMRLREWVGHTLSRKRNLLMVRVVQLHTPRAWGSGALVDGSHNCVTAATEELLMRSCLLQWLRFACNRRAARLQAYAAHVEHLRVRREQATMASVWQRWLLTTLSAAQARARATDLRLRYLRMWAQGVGQIRAADRYHRQLQLYRLGDTFRTWKAKAACQRRARAQMGAADRFYASVLLTHGLANSFAKWRRSCEKRVRQRRLSSAGTAARKELLQHLGMTRLIEGVFLGVDAAVAQKTGVQDVMNGRSPAQPPRTPPIPLRPPASVAFRVPEGADVVPVPRTAVSHAAAPLAVSVDPRRAPVAVDRATSPIPSPPVTCAKVHAETQTEAVRGCKGRTGPVDGCLSTTKRKECGRVSLRLREARPHQRQSQSAAQAASEILAPGAYAWSKLTSHELRTYGKAVIGAYRTVAAAAVAENEERILLELEKEQLLQGGPADTDECEEEREAEEERIRDLVRRLHYLTIRDEQRRHLHEQVQALERELARRTEEDT